MQDEEGHARMKLKVCHVTSCDALRRQFNTENCGIFEIQEVT